MQNTIVEMTQAWKKYQPALAPVANFTAIPYSDSEREGTQLNVDGRDLQQKVTNAVTQARVYTPQLEKNLAQIISGSAKLLRLRWRPRCAPWCSSA